MHGSAAVLFRKSGGIPQVPSRSLSRIKRCGRVNIGFVRIRKSGGANAVRKYGQMAALLSQINKRR